MALDRPQDVDASGRSGLSLAVICTAQLMVVLDATIMYVALPAIQDGLGFSAADLVWVSTYTLTFGGLLLLGGRSGDLFGRRRMFMAGIGVFVLASLAGGVAQSEVWLIAARAAQGVGGAIAAPTALALIATNFAEGPARNRAMGVYAAMSGAGSTVGLLAGGVLVQYVSWRWVLLVNVPIGVIVLLVAPRVLREAEHRPGRLDVPGAVSATAGMALLVYGFTTAATHGWSSPGTLACLGAAAVLLSVFGWVEARSTHPLMPLRVLADRTRAGAYTMMLCLGAAMFAFFYFMTQYLQDVLGYRALIAGLCFVPMSLGIMALSRLIARYLARTGIRVPLLVGPACLAGALIWVAQVGPASGYLGVIGPLMLLAVGMGASLVPLTVAAMAGVEGEESGVAAAMLNAGQMAGGAIGLSLLSTIAVSALHSRHEQLLIAHHSSPAAVLLRDAAVYGYHRAYLVGAEISILSLGIAAVLLRPARTGMATASGGEPEPSAASTEAVANSDPGPAGRPATTAAALPVDAARSPAATVDTAAG